mmetsp:Transcript_7320/g.14911  ORF Transcript_7320/g.14911 Transcript_7320/m.14911 type:complete len:157 (+) Transcript_7320:675-1145(+)
MYTMPLPSQFPCCLPCCATRTGPTSVNFHWSEPIDRLPKKAPLQLCKKLTGSHPPHLSQTTTTRAIELEPWSPEQICDLLAPLLNREKREDSVSELAKICHHKARGNDYCVLNYIQMLDLKNLIYFSMVSFPWEFDMDHIMAHTERQKVSYRNSQL